ncbi:hypothetical protein [Streptomyces sp. NPDC020965]|uniref:hypothetical protein n=1 Tax=Streptomyces sp. NPDC020965 TaxID=3365105 RepID=UPI0037BCEAD4
MPPVATMPEQSLDDPFDLDVREIKVINEGQEVTATGLTCTLFTCPALTCGTSCTGGGC